MNLETENEINCEILSNVNQHLMTPFIIRYVLYGKLCFMIIIQSVLLVLARCFKISLQIID